MWIILSGLASLAALLFALLWLRERRWATQREQLWRNVLQSVRGGDFEGALTLVEMLPEHSGTEALADEARQTLRGLRLHAGQQESARRELEDILAALQDAVLVVDADTRLRFLNTAATQLFEVRVEDVLGAQLLEALPTFAVESAVRGVLENGRSYAREINLYTPRVREGLLRVTPIRRSDGAISGAVAILQDLTEVRRLERVRRDFVANASHELRTPIANIRATAETILDASGDTALTERFLPRLVAEAERLSRLVTDLLNLARAEARNEVPAALVSLDDIACSVRDQLQDKAEQRQIELHCECEGKVLVKGDAASLEQVAFNLLDNALMYTSSGGRVALCVEARHHSSGDTDANAYGDAYSGAHDGDTLAVNGDAGPATVAVLRVSDTGIGVPAEDLPRIFERFYRVDKARSRAQGGTGLGLAIVKHIVENHGGHVRVESKEGSGSTFTVTLPPAS